MAKSVPTFPYQYKKINYGEIFNPVISLSLKASWGWQDLWFLVDSGADTTTIPLTLALRLGIKPHGSPSKIYGLGSQSLLAYPGEIILKISDIEITTRSYFINTDNSTILLGRLDIFDKFSITFDHKLKSIVFR